MLHSPISPVQVAGIADKSIRGKVRFLMDEGEKLKYKASESLGSDDFHAL